MRFVLEKADLILSQIDESKIDALTKELHPDVRKAVAVAKKDGLQSALQQTEFRRTMVDVLNKIKATPTPLALTPRKAIEKKVRRALSLSEGCTSQWNEQMNNPVLKQMGDITEEEMNSCCECFVAYMCLSASLSVSDLPADFLPISEDDIKEQTESMGQSTDINLNPKCDMTVSEVLGENLNECKADSLQDWCKVNGGQCKKIETCEVFVDTMGDFMEKMMVVDPQQEGESLTTEAPEDPEFDLPALCETCDDDFRGKMMKDVMPKSDYKEINKVFKDCKNVPAANMCKMAGKSSCVPKSQSSTGSESKYEALKFILPMLPTIYAWNP